VDLHYECCASMAAVTLLLLWRMFPLQSLLNFKVHIHQTFCTVHFKRKLKAAVIIGIFFGNTVAVYVRSLQL
jgi:hypothetical protein